MLPRRLALTSIAVVALALGGCTTTAAVDGGSTDTGAGGGSEGSGGGDVKVTVTVDGETWEYASFLCAVGYETIGSDVYSFSSTSFTTVDGDKIQFLLDVRDESGQDRVSGDGVVYEITVFDADNPTAPTVDVTASGESGVTIGDGTVTVDGDFVDMNDGATVYSIQADAVCN